MVENLYTPDCIRTFSGHYINVFNPSHDTIQIDDIAHALAHQPRFGGHLPEMYSVAQHSVLAAMRVEKPYKLQALMHDASEAYLMDIPRPIKNKLSNYKEIEDGLMRLIAEKFGFEYPLHSQVKVADEYMLNWEWYRLMLSDPGYEPIQCWPPEKAKRMFLVMFAAYSYKKTEL